MLFNSIDFLVFFIAFAVMFFLMKPKFRWVLLLAASYFFYMYWKWEYIFLIIFSTGVDYYCGRKMSSVETKAERKPFLLLSLMVNLSLLFSFKYLDFFVFNVNEIIGTEYESFNLILPMGISFYTFQTMAYSIDIYQGRIKAENHLGKFALYVSFFPQLVAGPIERAEKLLPQLQHNLNQLRYNNVVSGLTQVTIGFFKKVVIADLIAIYVTSIYSSYELNTGFTLLFATYLFAIQIYCDFSGYTDIAIGCARILGYDLMENFRMPYFSTSITEFWRRWHISLSTWLRDYLYIPLGGNRKGKIFTYRNLMLTMLLGGLWHGAAWNFIIWGALHGLYLTVERLTNFKDFIAKKSWFFKLISGVITFHLVCLAWIFFRAESFEMAMGIIERTLTFDYFLNLRIQDINVFGSIILTTGLFIFLEIFIFRKLNLRDLDQKFNIPRLVGIQAVLIIMIILFGVSEGSQFIYFQF
jgi:D-alanyl-lipoteichoic acid acyltransferase DltB (MBOAT superfamily)